MGHHNELSLLLFWIQKRVLKGGENIVDFGLLFWEILEKREGKGESVRLAHF